MHMDYLQIEKYRLAFFFVHFLRCFSSPFPLPKMYFACSRQPIKMNQPRQESHHIKQTWPGQLKLCFHTNNNKKNYGTKSKNQNTKDSQAKTKQNKKNT